jgi:hypothetical protein
MEFLKDIANGLVEHPTQWMLALTLIALAFLYKARSDDSKASLETILKLEGEHRETLVKIIPVAEKMTDSVEALERITAQILKD